MRFPLVWRNERPDAIADVVVPNAKRFGIVDAKVDALDILILGLAVHDIVEADIDQHVLLPVLRVLGLLLTVVLCQQTDLCRAALVDYPGCGSTIQGRLGSVEENRHVSLGVCVFGDALVDVQAGLVLLINLVDKPVDPVAFGLDDIGIAALVDLPAIVREPRTADELASGTAPLHLAEMKIASVGEIVFGRPGVGSGRGSDRLGGHLE